MPNDKKMTIADLMFSAPQPSGMGTVGGLMGGILNQSPLPTSLGILANKAPQGILNSGTSPQWLADELRFQSWIKALPWFQEFQQNYGEAPNISPSANYDYRAAHRAGITPVRDQYDQNRYHWPSSAPSGQMLKSADHPTAWKEHFMRETGQNPDAIGLKSPVEAALWKQKRRF
jgi:hypothetical protein